LTNATDKISRNNFHHHAMDLNSFSGQMTRSIELEGESNVVFFSGNENSRNEESLSHMCEAWLWAGDQSLLMLCMLAQLCSMHDDVRKNKI
jgi:hypothetical protein